MAPIKAKPQITAWSFSRKRDYDTCPYKAKLKCIDKLKEPSSPPMERGSMIHKLGENYVLGRIKRMPKELKLFAQEFKDLKKKLVAVESEWAFDVNWNPTGWFAHDCYVRMKIDVNYGAGAFLTVIDHKTGKVTEEKDQLELYAIGAFHKYRHIDKVQAFFWFLDQGEERFLVVHRSELAALEKKWKKAIKPMMNDRIFAPRPGNHCRWCHFSASKAGPCKY